MIIYDVSHPFALIGFIGGICVGVILYNALSLAGMKKRSQKLIEARDLILAGHAKKTGSQTQKADADFINKQLKKNEAKIKSQNKKKETQKKSADVPSEKEIMGHYSAAFFHLDNAEEILSAADFSFDPELMLDDDLRRKLAAFSEKETKDKKPSAKKKEKRESEKQIRKRAREKAKKSAENISLFDGEEKARQ